MPGPFEGREIEPPSSASTNKSSRFDYTRREYQEQGGRSGTHEPTPATIARQKESLRTYWSGNPDQTSYQDEASLKALQEHRRKMAELVGRTPEVESAFVSVSPRTEVVPAVVTPRTEVVPAVVTRTQTDPGRTGLQGAQDASQRGSSNTGGMDTSGDETVEEDASVAATPQKKQSSRVRLQSPSGIIREQPEGQSQAVFAGNLGIKKSNLSSALSRGGVTITTKDGQKTYINVTEGRDERHARGRKPGSE